MATTGMQFNKQKSSKSINKVQPIHEINNGS